MSALARAMHVNALVEQLRAKIARNRDEREERRSTRAETARDLLEMRQHIVLLERRLTRLDRRIVAANRRTAYWRTLAYEYRTRMAATGPTRHVVVAPDGTRVHFPALTS